MDSKLTWSDFLAIVLIILLTVFFYHWFLFPVVERMRKYSQAKKAQEQVLQSLENYGKILDEGMK